MVLKPVVEHEWDLQPRKAMALQRELAASVVISHQPIEVRRLAAVDVAFPHNRARAVVALFSYPELQPLETVVYEEAVRFPYIPGLLSFREAPPLLSAFEKVKNIPDVLLVDGQGLAHPRRFGIASHLGVLFDMPSVGCAKSILCGKPAGELPRAAGSTVALVDTDGTTIGALLRTRDGVSPVVVSVGNKVNLDWAVKFVLSCCRGYRIPEPIRFADAVSKGRRPPQSPRREGTLF
ncbi:MAG: endonuclease V [Planctomycetota bacterium]|nr:MAG: endonuclease V [Planctomycetota bacterium]